MKINNINETATAGSVGAGSIAVNMSQFSNIKTITRLDNSSDKQPNTSSTIFTLDLAKKINEYNKGKIKKKKKKKNLLQHLRDIISENYDNADVVSRLKALDINNTDSKNPVISYGIEDDKGNIMRVTVRSDQAKEFEKAIAQELEINKNNTDNGTSIKQMSLPELLYNLRNEFELVDVEFPKIPQDAIYNADEISTNGEFPVPPVNDKNEFTDNNLDNETFSEIENSEPSADSSKSETMSTGDEDKPNENDLESVEDFSKEDNTEISLINSVLGMMKADAEAKRAQADAEAEKSREKQAELTAAAANKELYNQEELAKMELAADEQKEKKKEAKKLADIAKYNVQSKLGSSTFRESYLDNVIGTLMMEDESSDTINDLNSQRSNINNKFQILPNDDSIAKAFKSKQRAAALKELDAKLEMAKNKQTYDREVKIALDRKEATPMQNGLITTRTGIPGA